MTPYSQLRNGPRIDLAKAHPLPAPLTIQVEPTNVCNFGCVMCPQSFKDFAGQSDYHQAMSMDLYKKMIFDIIHAKWQLKSLRLYGVGEPLLHPKIAEMAIRGHMIAERVEITTNGSLLDKHFDLIGSGINYAWLKTQSDAGVDYLQVSVYSVNGDRHTAITGQDRFTPSQVLRNVREFRAKREAAGSDRPFIYARLISDTEQGEADFRRIWEHEVDEIGVQYRHNWGGLVRAEDIKTREYAPNPLAPMTEFHYPKRACPFPFYLMYVHANGLVSACCIDWNCKLVIGDLREESLEQIWKGDRMAAIRQLHLAERRWELPSCANCDALYSTPDNIDELIVGEICGPY